MEKRVANSDVTRKSGIKNKRVRKNKNAMLALSIIFIIIAIFFVSLSIDQASASQPVVYTTVEVKKGDTLWDIAKTYCPNDKDIREYIYEIQEINNMDICTIYPGYVLTIPVYN